MPVFLGFIIGLIFGIVIGFIIHRDEMKELQGKYRFNSIVCERRIKELESQLNELKRTEGKINAGENIHGDALNNDIDEPGVWW